jgi:hypothetical protein
MSVEAARRYLERGFMPLPLGERSKRPSAGDGWERFTTTIDDARRHFERGNVGLLLGAPSAGLVDVDLDCDEAIELGSAFLPETGMRHGRAGAVTHFWYRSADVASTAQFKDPLDRATLVELRSTGGQTMVPPSVHPDTGEPLAWISDGDPADVTEAELARAVAKVAAGALLAKHWPGNGARHSAALALEGVLLRAAWAPDDVRRFVQAAARAAGDEEWNQRAGAPDATKRKLEDDEAIPGIPKLKEHFDPKIVSKVCDWLRLDTRPSGPSARPQVWGEKISQVQKLLELVIPVYDLFRAPDGTAYADMPRCAVPIRSDAFRDFLVGEFYRTEHKAPSENSLRNAVATVAAKARTNGDEREVFLRCAGRGGARFVDLANGSGQAIKIDGGAWETIDRSPVPFVRPAGLQRLPEPTTGGTLDELRVLINVGGDQQWALTLAWLLFALVGDGPFPILCVHGEQGSAKSTFARSVRALVDPHAAALRTLPGDLRDLAVAAGGSYVLAFDNVSVVKQEISDALCQMATGGSFATRKLYTDSEEQIFTAKRPIIVNGIEEVGRRSDLLERSILLSLPTIPEGERYTEDEFRAAWTDAYPRIFGALLTAAALTLAALPDVRPSRLLRMADFGRFAVAAEKALGFAEGTIVAGLLDNAARTHAVALEQSPIYSALRAVLQKGPFEGTITELLARLNAAFSWKDDQQKTQAWPKDGTRLSGMLNRLAPDLRADGIELTQLPRTSAHRRIRIAFVARKVAA